MKIPAVIAVIPLLPFVARAAEKSEPAPSSDSVFVALGYGEYRPSAKISETGFSGSVRRTVGDGELIWSGKVSDDTRLDLDFESKWTRNEFSGPAPYGDTQSHFLGAHSVTMLDDTWGFGVAGGIELAAETSADLFADGLRGGLGATLVWKASDTLSMETGFTVQTQYARDATLSPFIVWKWTVSKEVELGVRATGLTNGVYALWFVTENKATSAKLSLAYNTANYALRDGAFAEGFYTGDTPLKLEVTQFFTEHFFVTARTEITLDHRESFFTDGERAGTFRTGIAPAFALVVGMRY